MKLKLFNKPALMTLSIITLLSFASLSAADQTLYIIAHSSRATQTLTHQDIQNIYLGKIRSFPDGTAVTPINLMKGSSARDLFMKHILDINEFNWRSNWVRLLFTGKGKPPREFRTPQEIIDYVTKTESALAYVIGAEQAFDGIAVLNEIKP